MSNRPASSVSHVALWITCALLGLPLFAHAQADARQADHDALTALRDKFAQALNQRDFEAMKPLVTDSVTFISVSNQKVTGVDALKNYWNGLFEGENSVLKSLTVKPVADGPTQFLSETVGICQGTSQDSLDFRKVGQRELKTAWTSVVQKVGSDWKVSSVHMSANVLDNPMLKAEASVANIKLIVAAVIGILLGALGLHFLRGKRA